MATAVQPEDITRIAEGIQKKFLEEYKDSDKVDSRDYRRVKTCLPYVCKFVRHKMADEAAAYTMLAEAQEWRKTFGVQDLNFDNIDMTYFQNGVGIPHGEDKDGCTIVILNCHLHKKDAKKFPQLQKFFIFCLESHAREFPDKKMTMLFNMSECGISNMDMEFVKFIINCFKFYFPDMLNYLLVFEMPWVLQAAWRIIKGWLGEAAIRKIKFVTKSDITEFASADQLLVQFGGSDTWVYKYNPDELRERASAVWDHGDPLIMEDEDDLDERNMEDSVNKQVRFAPGQPPTRQSRYGDEDTDTPTPSEFRRGTASSPGYRRRQVHKLMSLQKQNDPQTSSLPPILEDNRRLSSHQPLLASASNTSLGISPTDELLFRGPADEELLCKVVLNNTTDNVVAYKIKTTAPNRYKVRPNINLIAEGETAVIQVKLLVGFSSEFVSQDKFLVQAYQFSAGVSPPDTTQLPNFWKTLGRAKNVEEYRLKCRYVYEPVQPSSSTEASAVASRDESSILVLQNKVDQLSAAVANVQNTINKIWYTCIVLLLVVTIILVLTL